MSKKSNVRNVLSGIDTRNSVVDVVMTNLNRVVNFPDTAYERIFHPDNRISADFKTPTVSIIMPLFDTEAFVEESIASIRQQSYKNWELIIIDDLSGDDSLDIVKVFADEDSRIRLYRNRENLGAAHARNLATQLANGRYIAFMDSDDVWEHEKLRMQVDFMMNGNEPFTYTSFTKIDWHGRMKRIVDSPEKVTLKQMYHANYICTSSVMYDTELLGKRYFPDILRRQDYGMWLNLLNELGTARGLPQQLTRYRVRNASLSGTLISRVKWNWRLHREIMGANVFVAFYRLIWNIVVKIFIKP